MRIVFELLALAGLAAASPAAAQAADWRYVGLTSFGERYAAIYIDAGTIAKADGRATFGSMWVLDTPTEGIDNFRSAYDADCTSHSFRVVDTLAYDGDRLVISVPRNETREAQPGTAIYYAIDVACGAMPLNPEQELNPVAAGAELARAAPSSVHQ